MFSLSTNSFIDQLMCLPVHPPVFVSVYLSSYCIYLSFFVVHYQPRMYATTLPCIPLSCPFLFVNALSASLIHVWSASALVNAQNGITFLTILSAAQFVRSSLWPTIITHEPSPYPLTLLPLTSPITEGRKGCQSGSDASSFRFTARKNGQVTFGVINLLLEMPITPGEVLSNMSDWPLSWLRVWAPSDTRRKGRNERGERRGIWVEEAHTFDKAFVGLVSISKGSFYDPGDSLILLLCHERKRTHISTRNIPFWALRNSLLERRGL